MTAKLNGVRSAIEVQDHRNGISCGAGTPPLESSSLGRERVLISAEEVIKAKAKSDNLTAFIGLQMEIARNKEMSLADRAIVTLNHLSEDIAKNIPEITPSEIAPKSTKEQVDEVVKRTRIRDGKTESPKTKSEGFGALLARIFSCFLCCFGRRK